MSTVHDDIDTDATDATDGAPPFTPEQMEHGRHAAADFTPDPEPTATADGDAEPTELVGRDKHMADVRAGRFMKAAEDSGTDETAPPQLVGREAHMAQVAAGRFLGGAQ